MNAATGLALCLALLAACGGEEAGRVRADPSVLLVTLDTTRADRIGAYGHRAAITPTIDRLAREGILFESALAPTPITLPSHASILTGVYPSAHGLRDNGVFTLGPDAVLVSEVFRRHGWRTGAFVGAYVLDARYGLDQGFEVYQAVPAFRFGNSNPIRPADEVVGDAIAWLSGLAPDERFFAWVHFYDPHASYQPPDYWRKRLEDPYDGEIAFCDDQLARLLRFLDERDLARNLLTVVTADHGDGLEEHGELYHGLFLYQTTLHVPLVLSGPPVAHLAGTRVEDRVSTASLPATLLALAGLPPGELPDVRVAPLLGPDAAISQPSRERALYVETHLPYHTYRWRALRGLVWRDHKLIEGREPELYALAGDPGEQKNLAERRAELVEAMRERLAELAAEHAALGWAGRSELDADARARLEALGYLAGSPGDDPFAAELPDPRERIGDQEALDLATQALLAWGALVRDERDGAAWQKGERMEEAREALEAARRALEGVRAEYDGNPHVTGQLGSVENSLGNHAAALPLLETALRERPFSLTLRFIRAESYYGVGRVEQAVREMETVVSTDARYWPAYRWLAGYYTGLEEFARAAHWIREELAAVEEGTPIHRETLERLAWVESELRRRGQPPEAAPAPDS